MKIKIGTLIKSIALPLLVGWVSSRISMHAMEMFAQMEKPPLSPPGWLFPVVWTILYILMGVASYIVYTVDTDPASRSAALWAYGAQLVFNFFWSIFFFNLEWYLFAFVWLLVLWILIIITIRRFAEVSKVAAYLLIPYLLWVTFAAYLNLGVWFLNRGM